jgi:predicted XRE-type DNA-binding protein
VKIEENGMDPTREFSEIISCRKVEGIAGMVPVKLLTRKLKNFSSASLVIPSGREPYKEFVGNLSIVKAVREVREGGIVPASDLLLRSNFVISLPVHVTPKKEHFSVVVELLQVQEATVSTFVAAIKSQINDFSTSEYVRISTFLELEVLEW